MEKVFTLQELQQIKKDFPIYDVYYLCVVRTFEKKWNHSKIYIVKLAEQFLSESQNWKDYEVGKRLLFYNPILSENIFNSEKDAINLRQIRLDFLDWLIKNTES